MILPQRIYTREKRKEKLKGENTRIKRSYEFEQD